MVAVPALALISVFMALLSQAQTAWVGLGAAFLYGLGAGAGRVALDGMVVDSVPPNQRATAVGMQFTFHDLWIGLGGAIMGPVAQATNYSAMYAIIGGVAIAATILFSYLTARTHCNQTTASTMHSDS
jgi:MFS family permease